MLAGVDTGGWQGEGPCPRALMQWLSMRTRTEGYSVKSTMSFCPSWRERKEVSSCGGGDRCNSKFREEGSCRVRERGRRRCRGRRPSGRRRGGTKGAHEVVRVVEEEVALARELDAHRCVGPVVALGGEGGLDLQLEMRGPGHEARRGGRRRRKRRRQARKERGERGNRGSQSRGSSL